MIYYTDEIVLNRVTKNPETGKVTESANENLQARVETYNNTILSESGKYEKADYLVFIDDITVKQGDYITLTSVMGNPVTKFKYDVKKSFYAGGFSFCQMELYL